MTSDNSSIFNYVIDHAAQISERWFERKDGEIDSIYSKKTTPSVEKMLRKQHTYTIHTIMSAFLEDQSIFTSNLEIWANEVAKSRVELGTPVHEVLQALSLTRETIWEVIEEYIKQQKNASSQQILEWSTIYQLATDQLINLFTRMYHEYTLERFNAQQKLIQQLSFPVIPITDEIGILPIIGDIDSLRARLILENVPVKCKEDGIHHLFIDLSGIAGVDTFVLHELLKLIDILGLIGIDSTLSGLSPETAQMISSLGIRLEHISTYSTLKQSFSNHVPSK